VLSILDGATLAAQTSLAVPPSARLVRGGELDGDGVDDLVVGDGFEVTRWLSRTQLSTTKTGR
jgi:hypothetical protein